MPNYRPKSLDFINAINSGKQIIVQVPNPEYRNMVFEGAGARSIGYIGALEVMNNYGFLDDVVNVSGSSAGSIVALLFALGFTSDEILEDLMHFDYGKFIGKAKDYSTFGKLMEIITNARHSLSDGDELLKWLRNIVKKKLGNENATFKDLHEAKLKYPDKKLKDLYLTIEINSYKYPECELVSHENPLCLDIPLAEAVRGACTFPLVFKLTDVKFGAGPEKDLCADGGCYDNFPVRAFDNRKDIPEGYDFTEMGTNPATFALKMDSREEANQVMYRILHKLNLDSLYQNIYQYFLALSMRSDINDARYKRNVLALDDCGVETLNLSLDVKDKTRLVDHARKAAYEYLQNHVDTAYTIHTYNSVHEWLSDQSDEELTLIKIAYQKMQKSLPEDAIEKRAEIKNLIRIIMHFKKNRNAVMAGKLEMFTIKYPDHIVDIKPDFSASKWSAKIKKEMIARLEALDGLIVQSKTEYTNLRKKLFSLVRPDKSDLNQFIRAENLLKKLEYEQADLQIKSGLKHAPVILKSHHESTEITAYAIFCEKMNPFLENPNEPLKLFFADIDLCYPVINDGMLDLREPLDRNIFLIALLLFCKYKDYACDQLLDIFKNCQPTNLRHANEKIQISRDSLSSLLQQKGIDLKIALCKIDMLLQHFELIENPDKQTLIAVKDPLTNVSISEKNSLFTEYKEFGIFKCNPAADKIITSTDNILQPCRKFTVITI